MYLIRQVILSIRKAFQEGCPYFIGGKSQAPCLNDVSPCHAIQRFVTKLLLHFRRWSLQDIGSASLLGGDQPGFVQHAVCPGYGIKVHPQFRCQLPHGGQFLPGIKPSTGNQVADLLHDLQVDGQSCPEIQLNLNFRHCLHFSYCIV